jgi:transcriptional regulator with XRE-family HTH domain
MEAAGRPHFGALLRRFRLDAGLTQQELAEQAELSAEAISLLERGARTRPHRETVALLGPLRSSPTLVVRSVHCSVLPVHGGAYDTPQDP